MTRKHDFALVLFFLASAVWLSPTSESADQEPAASASASVRVAVAVAVVEQNIVIPTYLAGEPERSPMFFFGRQSQGAEGRIYPYPLYDTLTGQKADKSYRLVTLENEYVRIGILPEIGGRVFEAVDKTNGYHFFYRQHVIKPALIGLIGAWISGGVEWNIPHHHRASTFLPVQYRIEQDSDGGKTVWVGELELRHRMRWAVGYSLRPGSSVLEAKVRIINRTPVVNTMLCFANVAVHANQDYQVIFPPDTQYVTHHHKREFTTWPIATTRYGGYDFRPATDVSWYKNHLAANSMFAWNDADDFFAGYDHGKRAGTMSVADHDAVPGKKLWTWGNGPRGRMWDKILTDEDGPYIELMVGAYSDNQPDYSWLQPFEVKSFSMNWYPFRDIGGVKYANLNGAVNLEIAETGRVKLGFYTTSRRPGAIVRLHTGEKLVFEKSVDIDPGHPFVAEAAVPAGTPATSLRAGLSFDGKELIAYRPEDRKPEPMPEPDRPHPAPGEIKTVEELYLTGLRIDQFHDPALEPEPYWNEAVRRDPGDARAHTALGIRELKRVRYSEAESHLRGAIRRLTTGYAKPEDGKPYYYLGLALKGQGRDDEARAAFARSTWSLAWRGGGDFAVGELDAMRGDWTAAIGHLDGSLEAGAINSRALCLKAAVLRHQGRSDHALKVLDQVEKADPLDVRAMAERWLASQSDDAARVCVATMLEHPATALATAAEYLSAGLWEDGLAVLSRVTADAPDPARLSPMLSYYRAFFAERLGRSAEAAKARAAARAANPDRTFPFQPEDIPVLRAAMSADPRDPRAPYYLGNLLYDWQPEQAVDFWNQAAAIDPAFPMVHRNLAIAGSQRPGGNDLAKAIGELEQAVSLPDPTPLHFVELDELYRAAGRPPEARLAILEKHSKVVARRAEALSREIGLLILVGRCDDAITLMTGRRFEVWEGGKLSVAEDWTMAHVLRALRRRSEDRCSEALADLAAAEAIPDNLPSDEGTEDHRAEIAYATGIVHEAMGSSEKARSSWQAAAAMAQGPARGRHGAQQFHAAMALRKLGKDDEARTMFQALIDGSPPAAQDLATAIDGSAPALAQQAARDRLASNHYLAGLGYLGLGRTDEARRRLSAGLEASPDHLGARTALKQITRPD